MVYSVHPENRSLWNEPPSDLDSKSHRSGQKSQYLIEDYIPPSKKSSHDLTHTYCWDNQVRHHQVTNMFTTQVSQKKI